MTNHIIMSSHLRQSALLFFLLLPLLNLVGQSVLVTDLHLTDLAYHPGEDQLYGLVSSERIKGNALLQIDPRNGQVSDTIALSYSPSVCRFSPDYRYLYIGYLGINHLDRYDTQTNQLSRFAHYLDHEGDPNTELRTNDLLPLPGGLVMVASRWFGISPENAFTQVYNGPNYLPNQIVDDLFQKSRRHVYHPGSGYIYSFGNEYRNGDLVRYTFDAQGIQYDATFEMLNRSRQDFFLHEDRLYFQYGDVVDISSGSPEVVGNYRQAIGNISYNHGVAAMNTAQNQLYVLEYRSRFGQDPAGNYLHLVDPENFSEMERIYLADVPNALDKMVATGAERFAIISKPTPAGVPLSGQLIILGACAAPPTPNSLSLSLPQTEFCVGDTLQVEGPGGYSDLIWQDGSRGAQFEQIFPYTGPQPLQVKAYDPAGCLLAASPVYDINVVAPPSRLEVSGPSRFCQGESIQLETSSVGADRFVWSNGNSEASIEVSEAGTYTVQAYRGACDQYLEAEINTSYYSTDIPTPVLYPQETQEVCMGDSVLFYTEQPPSPYQIEWSHNGSSVAETYVFERNDYSVRYRDPFGCYGPASNVVQAFFSRPPNAPTYYTNDSLIQASFTHRDQEKQWYRNDTLLLDSVNLSMIMDTTGFYSLRVRQYSECWSAPSDFHWFEGIDTDIETARLRAQLFVDFNGNTQIDGQDFLIAGQAVLLSENGWTGYTNTDGEVSFIVNPATYTIEAMPEPSTWDAATPLDTQVADMLASPDSTYLFPISPLLDTTAVRISIMTSPTRCNERVSLWVNATNTGTRPISGELCISLDPLITATFIEAFPIDPVPSEYCWEVFDLLPGQDYRGELVLQMPNEQSTGETLSLDAQLQTFSGGRFIAETYQSTIRCAYDPNDKLVSPAYGFGENYALLDDTLYYTIRFQNTGNDTARRVRLEDQLSEDLLWETFFPVAASHPYELVLKQQTGELEVFFDQIMLPDSNINVAGSQGFFTFGILARPGLEEFSMLDNTAGIFFDFNAPVITNTITSTLVSTFDADEDGFPLWLDCRDDLPEVNPEAEEVPDNGLDDDCLGGDLTATDELLAHGLKVFPNPTSGVLQLTQTEAATLELRLFSATGQLLRQYQVQRQRNQLELEGLAPGLYLLHIQRGNSSGMFRIVKL